MWILVFLGWIAVAAACENPAVTGVSPEAEWEAAAGSGAPRPAFAADHDEPHSRSAFAGVAACAGEIASDTCDGIYAVRTDLDVYWSDELHPHAPAFDPGRGVIRVVWLSRLAGGCEPGGERESLVRVCGVEFPTVYADASGTAMQFMLPAATWRRPDMPMVRTRAHVEGGAVMLEHVDSTFGIELEAQDAPWPSHEHTPFVPCAHGRTGPQCFVDQDGDGKAGISVYLRDDGEVSEPAYPRRGGWRYAPMPSDANAGYLARGAQVLHAGLRLPLGGAHPVGGDCFGGRGKASAGQVALRVLECEMQDGDACSASGAAYVDENVPVFRTLEEGERPPANWKHLRGDADRKLDRGASAGAWNDVVRLGGLDAAVSCEDARAVF